MLQKAMEVNCATTRIAGKSWLIDRDGKTHIFHANSRNHPNFREISAKWLEIAKLIAYKPDLRWVVPHSADTNTYNTDTTQRQHMSMHSEKLAMCFGLIFTSSEENITIVNNLRMCGDCHSSIALTSKLVRRTIFVRDAKTWHTFKDGECVCGGLY